jgi:hypothetical protein
MPQINVQLGTGTLGNFFVQIHTGTYKKVDDISQKIGDILFILLKMSGMDCSSPKGHYVHGMHRPRDGSSKEQIIQGTDFLWDATSRDGSSMGRCVQGQIIYGTLCPGTDISGKHCPGTGRLRTLKGGTSGLSWLRPGFL